MDRCPNCNARHPGEQQCRRCGMELQVLSKVVDYHDHWVQQGITCLMNNDMSNAKTCFQRACFFQNNSISRSFLTYSERCIHKAQNN